MKVNPNTCRGFAVASMACAAISLFLGGILLGALGFAFGLYGFSHAKKLVSENPGDPQCQYAYRVTRNSLIFCGIAAVVNLLAALYLYPTMMETMGVTTTGSAF